MWTPPINLLFPILILLFSFLFINDFLADVNVKRLFDARHVLIIANCKTFFYVCVSSKEGAGHKGIFFERYLTFQSSVIMLFCV